MVKSMVRPQEKITRLFEILEERGPLSMTKLARLANMHPETVTNYVDMVIYIQNKLKIEKIVSERTTLVRLR